MPTEWGRFWIAIAIMVLAGAIVFGAVLRSPFNVGSIGQWASAFGTTIAVWVAVSNTTRTLKATADREDRKQRVVDRAYVAAVISLANSVHSMIETTDEVSKEGEIAPADARESLHASNLEGLVSAIDRIPLHQAPAQIYIKQLELIRTAAHNAVQVLSAAGNASGPTQIDVSHELGLAKRALDRLERYAEQSQIAD